MRYAIMIGTAVAVTVTVGGGLAQSRAREQLARGIALWDQRLSKSAVTALENASRDPSTAAEAHEALGRIYTFKGWQQESVFPGWHDEPGMRPRALSELRAAVAADPARASAAEALRIAEGFVAADAVEPAPPRAEVRALDARLQSYQSATAERIGSDAGVVAAILAAVDARSKAQADPAPYFTGAQMLLDRGEYDRAIALADHGAAVSDRFIDENLSAYQMTGKSQGSYARGRAAAADLMGWALFQKKDYAAARAKLDEAAQLTDGGDAVNQFHLGELARAQNEPERAREYYLSALTISGGPAPLRQRITMALSGLHPGGNSAESVEAWLGTELARRREDRRAAALKSLIDRPLPTLTLTTIEGRPFDASILQGKVLLLDFFASWCGSCRAELPHLKAAFAKYQDDPGVVFLFVSIDEDTRRLQRFLTEMKFPFRVARMDAALAEKTMGFDNVPQTFYVDPRGVVRYQTTGGESHGDSPARVGWYIDQLKRAATPPFRVAETSLAELQTALAAGRVTSREIVGQYLIRLALYEHRVHAAIAVNPRALDEAAALDRERAAGRIRGPLHGIPVALKDNIHTTDMPTTGGALAFAGYVPPYEATLTKNLRDAGAIIIAKTGMTELANWVAGAPNPMPGNYNAVGGFGYNPYDPRPDPRDATFDGRPALQTGGSSSGIGTAASLWAASVGTDTGGSVISPSNANMLVGIRPTIGRISRYGVIPITADHDTAGPMARTVTDAAIMMGALESASPDPRDPATQACAPPSGRDYTQFLNADGLKGARIGIPRAFYYDRVTLPGEDHARGGLNAEQAKVMGDAIAVLERKGAIVVDPADVPSFVAKDEDHNFVLWDFCSGADQAKGKDEHCSVNFKYGMKRDFNAWLRSLGPTAPVKTLTELREWNLAHVKAGAIRFGQSRLDISDEMDLEKDRTRNDADHRKDWLLSRTNGIDGALAAQRLDAILTPGGAGAGLAARAGYPIIVVPFGLVPNAPDAPFPAGFDARPAPFGVGFTGAACSEPKLIAIAYAFEQATRKRVAPPSTP